VSQTGQAFSTDEFKRTGSFELRLCALDRAVQVCRADTPEELVHCASVIETYLRGDSK